MASGGLYLAVYLAASLPALVFFIYSLFQLPKSDAIASRRLEAPDDGPETSRRHTQVYSDADGVATKQSMIEAADVPVRVLLAAASLLTLIAAVTRLFIIRTISLDLSLLLIGWTLVAAQSVVIAFCRSPRLRFSLGLLGALSTVFLLAGSFLEVITSTTKRHGFRNRTDVAYAVQLVFAVATLILFLSLQRRPALFRHGRPVDAQYSTSMISRYTLSWSNSLFSKSRAQGTLDVGDLPELEQESCSKYLLRRISRSASGRRPLWQRVIRDHAWDLSRQWTSCTLESVAMFVPQICLYKLLSLLEKRYAGDVGDGTIWFWSGALVVFNLVHLLLEVWTRWLSWGVLSVKLRSQLTALVYDKSINQPDIKQLKEGKGDKTKPDEVVEMLLEPASETDPLLPKEVNKPTAHQAEVIDIDGGSGENEDEDEENELGITNLVGVDIDRLAYFAAENIDLLGSIWKSLFGAILLIKILGPWPTLAGLAVPVVFSIPSKLAQRGYHNANDRVMSTRDKKTHVITEILQGMRQIKFASMEKQWQDVIMKVRAEEIKHWWTLNIWGIILTACWLAVPILVGATALSVYAFINHTLTPAVAFTALATLSSLEYTLSVVPAFITELLDAIVSLNRLDQHLSGPVQDRYISDSPSISLQDATICWPALESSTSQFVLRDLTLAFPKGRLSVIVGKTGSGKSLLLAALAGEAQVVRGRVLGPVLKPDVVNDGTIMVGDWIIPSATAFVAQIPWIENASIKDNITYGLPMNRQRYLNVLDACALNQDIDALEDRDNTEVGTSGINISGGQRWRLTLARALYSRAQTLLLDDIFSAVDSHVGAHILETAVLGDLCKGRTVIIATHHAGLVLPHTALVVRLGEDGTLEGVERPNKALSQADSSTEFQNEGRLTGPDSKMNGLDLEDKASADVLVMNDGEQEPLTNTRSHSDKTAVPRKFVEDETREVGAIKFDLIKTYLKASGGASHWALLFLVLALGSGLTLGRSFWVKIWSEDSPQTNSMQPRQIQGPERTLTTYLFVYIGLSLISVSFIAIKVFVILLGAVRAGTRLFRDLTETVFRANLRWLDTVPTGRILNRFVGDFTLIDTRIGSDLMWGLSGVFTIIIIIASALFVSPYMIVPVILLFVASGYVAFLYLGGARGLKRLESTSRSPIFDLINTTMLGLATIRTFGKTHHYITKMTNLIDAFARADFYLELLDMWLGVRQGLLGTAFLSFIIIFLLLSPSIDAALAGFVLSFALELSNVTEDTINRYTGFELDMNAAERVVEYTKIPTEPISGDKVQDNWPQHGKIEIRNLEVAYAPGLELVLKGISFTIEAGERVGIIGRTGSGKSTFTLALFRFLDQRRGQVIIDDIDATTVPLNVLRSRLSIIPQDPVLFTGTLRSNLDPWNRYSDIVLLETLRRVHLIGGSATASGTATPVDRTKGQGSSAPSVTSQSQGQGNIFTNLSHPISRGGLNLSQGQRQLVCLARAILTQPSVMVLDEATSAVDMATDALIQRSIREGFKDSTLLVIAHRLSTVMDFDKIVVLGGGKVVEMGSPKELWADTNGAFRGMCDGSGESEHLRAALGYR